MSDLAERVKEILEHPLDFEWSIQGLGMLRTYLDPDGVQRLHIWDPVNAVDEVSTIHDHPWDFASEIVSGVVRNQRYVEDLHFGMPHMAQDIRCGVDGGLIGEPRRTGLQSDLLELYTPGQGYSQLAPELHESFPDAGAVTVITRTFHEQCDFAHVFWQGERWVSAEPRPATPSEVMHFAGLARHHWDAG